MKSKTGEEYIGSECQREIGELLEEYCKKLDEVEGYGNGYPRGRDCCSPAAKEFDRLYKELGRKQQEIMAKHGFGRVNELIKPKD